jgi:hypothetical protein
VDGPNEHNAIWGLIRRWLVKDTVNKTEAPSRLPPFADRIVANENQSFMNVSRGAATAARSRAAPGSCALSRLRVRVVATFL